MASRREIVITGIGVVSPIGIGNEAFWQSLAGGRSGVGPITRFDTTSSAVPFGAEIADFEAKDYVRPRKSLKVMSRDIQLAFAAADLACRQAQLDSHPVDPERLGVVFGASLIACEPEELINAYRECMVDGRFEFQRWGQRALGELFPLWMLKYLPNMAACHVGIAHDARGPNNTITVADVSSLLSVAEAVRVIERGHADAMIAGGTSSRINPTVWAHNRCFELSGRCDDPAAACRPFDAMRDGMVHGEGAGAFLLESREQAEARGVRILARVLGYATTCKPHRNGRMPDGSSIRTAIAGALQSADLTPADIGHVNAHGVSTPLDDRIEAQAIRDTVDDVPVTALKSYFGNWGPGTGAVEMAGSVLALPENVVPPTLNYEYPDPECPVNVVRGGPQPSSRPTALVLNHADMGQAVAMILAAD